MARGLEPGDRVALVAPNNWFFVVSYLAALGAGAVVVPLNPMAPAMELERELAAVGARTAVVGPSGREAFAGVDRSAVGLEEVFVPEGAQLEGAQLEGATSLEELFSAEPAPVVDRTEDDDALLMFTAGTAGPPKAARLTHGNLVANLDQVQRHPGLAVRPQDVGLGVLPLFHIFGLNVVLGLTLRLGATVVLVERFDAAATLAVVREHGVTVLAGAPPMYNGPAVQQPAPSPQPTATQIVPPTAPVTDPGTQKPKP